MTTGSVKSFDKKNGTLELKESPDVVRFKQLLIADGAQRATTKKLQPDLVESDLSDSGTLLFGGAAAVHFEIRETRAGVPEVSALDRKKSIASMPKKYRRALRALGWSSSRLPAAIVIKYGSATHLKLYVTCEIPMNIVNMSNAECKREKTAEWASLLTRMAIWSDGFDEQELVGGLRVRDRKSNVDPDGKHPSDDARAKRRERKEKLDVQAWKMALTSISKEDAVARMDDASQSPRMMVTIGDAFEGAFFPLGHGANDAIAQAVAYAKGLSRTEDGELSFDSTHVLAKLEEHRGLLHDKLQKLGYFVQDVDRQGSDEDLTESDA